MKNQLERETPNKNKMRKYERPVLLDIIKGGGRAFIYFGGKNLHALACQPIYYKVKFIIKPIKK